MYKVRLLNNYRVLFIPDHPSAMESDNWVGWVYEHIVIMERELGRKLESNEVVHHLDGDRTNNRIENLLVLDRGQHTKLYQWIDSGRKFHFGECFSMTPKCERCGLTLQRKQKRFCSVDCKTKSSRIVERPTSKQLYSDLVQMNWSQAARKYGVSGNTVRKWAKRYGILVGR